MVAMRNRFVAAIRRMLVPGVVAATGVRFRAIRGIRTRDVERVLVDVTLVHVMQMAVMQVIDMPSVLDLGMRTVGTMLVRMLVVNGVFHRQPIPG